MRVLHDIEWDLEDCAVDPDILELPDSVDVPDDIEDNDIENWLSDEFGFLVLAYEIGHEPHAYRRGLKDFSLSPE